MLKKFSPARMLVILATEVYLIFADFKNIIITKIFNYSVRKSIKKRILSPIQQHTKIIS